MKTNWGTLVGLVLLQGCFPWFESWRGQWQFQDTGIEAWGAEPFRNGVKLLPGTRVRPQRCTWIGEGEDRSWDQESFRACFEQILHGPGTLHDDGPCFDLSVDGPGEVALELQPQGCSELGSDADPVEDYVSFEGADPDILTVRLEPVLEEAVEAYGQVEPEGIQLEQLVLAPGETLRVLEGSELRLYLQLWDPEAEQPVAWRRGDGGPVLTVQQGEAELLDSAGLGPRWIRLWVGEGAQAELDLEILGQRWGGIPVEAVPEEDVQNIELVMMYVINSESEGLRQPIVARAVLWDADGRLVQGGTVLWRQEGDRLALAPGSEAWIAEQGLPIPGGDHAMVMDVCGPVEGRLGERSSTLHALLGKHRGSLEIHWTTREDLATEQEDAIPELLATCPPNDEEPDPAEPVPEGCGCSSPGGAAVDAVWLLGLLALVGVARSRSPAAFRTGRALSGGLRSRAGICATRKPKMTTSTATAMLATRDQ